MSRDCQNCKHFSVPSYEPGTLREYSGEELDVMTECATTGICFNVLSPDFLIWVDMDDVCCYFDPYDGAP